MTLDIESVLVTHHHLDRMRGLCMNQQGAPCGWEGMGPEEWRAHVAAVLREQIAAWLGSEGAVRIIARGWYLDPDWHKGPESSARAALAALAEQVAQVACVDPSRSEGGSTDPEVRQSSDRTSAPSRVPGGGIVSGVEGGCNCIVTWDALGERFVWHNGSLDGSCGHPATGEPVDASRVPSTSEGEGA